MTDTVGSRTVGRLGAREFIFFLALISASSALAIDILAPAFSEMRPAFGLSEDATDLSLTITLFFLGTGVGNLFVGPLADSIGRRRLLVGSMVVYGLAALLAAAASSLWVLFAARFVWGFASAGPRVLSQAIVRDLYSGDAMARVMTLVHAAFTIGPIVAPVISAGLVAAAGWRIVMLFGTAVAAVVVVWNLRFEETLDPAHRRAFDPTTVLRGFVTVLAHPVSRGYILSVTVAFGAFFSFLASTELLFDDVFGRPELFVPYFSGTSMVFGIVAVGANRFLRRHTATTLITLGGATMLVASLGLLALSAATNGRPPLAAFLVLFTIANASHQFTFPTMNSLALTPMGELAGTAAAVLGVLMSVVGAGLAALIDRAIDGTIWPVALGYAVYSAVAFALQFTTTRATSPST